MAEGLISLRAFAKRRGVSLKAVQKAIASGRVQASAIERTPAGRITGIRELEATQQWNANTDPVEATRNGKLPAQSNTSPSAPVVPDPASSAAGSGPEVETAAPLNGNQAYLESRARREMFESRTAELDYLKAVGLVVPANDVRESLFRRYRTLRDKLLNVPDRVATIIAAERDPVVVHKLLTDELKRVLNELSDGARLAAAGGDSERMAA